MLFAQAGRLAEWRGKVETGAFQAAFETLASLYVTGCPVRLERLFKSPNDRRVSLPLYPFRPDRHWLHTRAPVEKRVEVKRDLHPLLGQAVSIGSRRAVFEVTLSASHPGSITGFSARPSFPGTA
jgi:acyl transferase domain-containing protein